MQACGLHTLRFLRLHSVTLRTNGRREAPAFLSSLSGIPAKAGIQRRWVYERRRRKEQRPWILDDKRYERNLRDGRHRKERDRGV